MECWPSERSAEAQRGAAAPPAFARGGGPVGAGGPLALVSADPDGLRGRGNAGAVRDEQHVSADGGSNECDGLSVQANFRACNDACNAGQTTAVVGGKTI